MRNDAIVILSLMLLAVVLILVTFFNGNDDFLAGTIDLNGDESKKELEGSIEFLCDNSKGYYDYFAKISSKFSKEYENSEVIVNKTDDYKSTIKIRMNSGDLPDIWEIDSGVYLEKAIEKYALNISNNLPEVTSSFADNILIKSESGDVFAMPVGFKTDLIIYNKKIFKDLELEIPKTYSQLINLCEIVKNEDLVPFGIGAKDEGRLDYFLYILPKLITSNPNALNEILNDTLPLNSESSVYYSYDILRYFKTKGYLGETPLKSTMEDDINNFKNRKISMLYLNSTELENIIEDNFGENDFGVFPFPVTENSEKYNVIYEPYLNMAVSSYTKKLEISKNWIKFIYNTNYEEIIESIGLKSSKISVDNKSFYFKEFDKYKVNEIDYIINSEELNDFLQSVKFDKQQTIKEIFDGNSLKNIFSIYNEKWRETNKKEQD
jgi:raffinose/stachyose/melibiose transport system substrate-binding protein